MDSILNFFIFIPLAGFLLSFLISGKKEAALSNLAFYTTGLNLAGAIAFSIFWLLNHHPVLNLKEIVLFKSGNYEFFVDFYFDKITAVYLLVGAFLTFLVTKYSRYYLHREKGYKRFFNTILFFYLGYNITIFSGNLETLFIGWEILGVSSFLLIAFYRDRYLPVKNALKVFSIYRIGDVGIILAMWMSHHLWHENITFLKLNNAELVSMQLQNHSWVGIFISVMILLSALAKSAQFPFTSWLPRAMEGPTPSSAIFYGSLAVHMGAFLLMRTFTFWEHQYSVRILIAVIGLLTSILATSVARVQSSVKTQIAYSSAAQIGLIFIEISAGFEILALIHFAGNAFLRTYQLLVSPSVVAYKIREQFYNFVPRPQTIEDSFPRKIEYSLYVMSLKEWNLDSIMHYYLWHPLKWAGRRLRFLNAKSIILLFIPAYILGIISLFSTHILSNNLHHYLSGLFALIALVSVLRSFAERKSVLLGWTLIIMNHFWIALAVSFNEHFDYSHSLLYLSGVVVFGFIGLLCLQRIKSKEGNFNLENYAGHSHKYKKTDIVFLLACLGLTGFPISPTFIGEDLIFSHIHANQVFLAFITSLCFIVDGLAVVRIYTRVFLGPNVQSEDGVPFRSS